MRTFLRYLRKISLYFFSIVRTSSIFQPSSSFQVHTVLFLKSDFSIYFLFFCFNNNIPCFTSFYVYMFQFNFLISLLKSCFFLRFKSSALGMFFENNSICSVRFFHLSSVQISLSHLESFSLLLSLFVPFLQLL